MAPKRSRSISAQAPLSASDVRRARRTAAFDEYDTRAAMEREMLEEMGEAREVGGACERERWQGCRRRRC